MMYGPGAGFGWFQIAGAIIYGLFTLLFLLALAAIAFILVRFLLVATTAARLYIAKNGPLPSVTPLPDAPNPPATTTTTPIPMDAPPVAPPAPRASREPRAPEPPAAEV